MAEYDAIIHISRLSLKTLCRTNAQSIQKLWKEPRGHLPVLSAFSGLQWLQITVIMAESDKWERNKWKTAGQFGL